jgi:hypothetical protein
MEEYMLSPEETGKRLADCFFERYLDHNEIPLPKIWSGMKKLGWKVNRGQAAGSNKPNGRRDVNIIWFPTDRIPKAVLDINPSVPVCNTLPGTWRSSKEFTALETALIDWFKGDLVKVYVSHCALSQKKAPRFQPSFL